MMPCGAKSSRCSNTTGARPSWILQLLRTWVTLCRSGDSFIGQAVGPYVISGRLGAGGMGEVYRARDQKLGRDVAIKVLPPAFTANAERLARFAREARVLAALNHPNIGAIYGLEEGNGINALVLELVEGETLSARIERGPIPMQTALRIARQIADALDTSHEKGIVHRDLKPANIKITPAGDVKVLDFGLAKAAGGDSVPDLSQSPTITVGGTHAGVILGTAAYMSPEQARGQPVDKRTDVWAFGCVLYEMLAGRPAFSGSTMTDTLAAILEREPDWTALPRATSDAIHRLLRRCLEKDARLRLHDIADARIEIDDELRPDRTDPPLKSGRRLKILSAAVALGALAIVTAWAVSRIPTSETSGSVLRLQINPPPGGQFGGRVGANPSHNLALSPDGKTLVYSATVNGQFALWVHPLDGTKATLLPGSEDAYFPSWSLDGRYIAFVAKGKLQRIDVTGGPPFAVSDVPLTFGNVWTPDHGILLGLFSGTLATVPASGGTLSPLTTLDKSTEIAHVWPQVLPGGHFLYWGGSSKPEDNGVIYAASFDKPNDRIRLFPSVTRALYAASRDGHGHLLWQRSGTLLAQEFDGATLRFSGEPRPIADGVGILAAAADMAVSVSNTGTLVYAPQELFQLTWFDRGGKHLGTLGDPGQYLSIRFSPDGKQIATTRTEVGRELWLMDVDRGTSSRATFDSRGGFYAQWSPDGRTIVFIGDNITALYRKDATGVAPDERLAPWQPPDALTDWSLDARLLLNTRYGAQTGGDIWVVPVTPDGHLSADQQPTPYLRTPVNETAARFSPEPNPRWIAYQSDESGRNEVYIQAFPQPRGAHRVSTRGGTRPQWGPGGRELFYQSLDSKVMVVSLNLGPDTVAASEPRELFVLPPRASFFEMAPDGQRFLVNMPDPMPHPLNVIVNWPSLLKSGTTGQ